MNVQAAFDFSPLSGLLLIGGLLALGPALWVWFKNRAASTGRRVQAVRVLTLFLTFDLILFGAFTRLTDSGLGCPDWPGCYGNASPLGATDQITQAQTAMPTGPVTHAKAWIEMLHRYIASGVGFLILLLTVKSWHDWLTQRRNVVKLNHAAGWPRLSTLTVFWVCLQGAFGAWTVTMKLFPLIVTLHLLGALVLLVLLGLQVAQHAAQKSQSRAMPAGLPGLLVASLLLLFMQIALGGWVSSNYAVLVCSDFPTCQGHWWPEMDFRAGFELWRGLGVTGSGELLSFTALTAIHVAHRLMAYVVLALLMVLAWQLNRFALWRLQARVLAGLIGLQLATGLSNVVLGWPMLSALLHTGGAAALVMTLIWTLSSTSVLKLRPLYG
jgi:cytochrome c oxidase assembly protein subunit 15